MCSSSPGVLREHGCTGREREGYANSGMAAVHTGRIRACLWQQEDFMAVARLSDCLKKLLPYYSAFDGCPSVVCRMLTLISYHNVFI